MSWKENNKDNIARWTQERRERKTWQQRSMEQIPKARKEDRLRLEGLWTPSNRVSKVAGKDFDLAAALDVQAFMRCHAPVNSPRIGTDMIDKLVLKPGVAVIYQSKIRYAQAPEEALTIDMFDATLPLTDEVLAGGKQPRITQRSQELHTSMVFEDEIPEFLVGKMGVLRVTLQSLRPEKCDPGFLVAVPEVGVAYATGAFWILITEDDLKGTPWEERDAP